MPIPAEFEAHLKRVDPDRWLAARLVADPAQRAELLALYALNDELARVAESVREPMLGEMRLAWWGEQLDAAQAGRPPRGHPVLEAVAPALAEGRLPRAPLDAMLEARAADLLKAPFADEAALLRWLDGSAGALMTAAARLLDPRAAGVDLTAAARAWGWASLLRAAPAWEARGRSWLPLDWPPEPGPAVPIRVEAALRGAAPAVRALPVASFPAVAYATLARDYAAGRAPGPVVRRARLLWASMRGRI